MNARIPLLSLFAFSFWNYIIKSAKATAQSCWSAREDHCVWATEKACDPRNFWSACRDFLSRNFPNSKRTFQIHQGLNRFNRFAHVPLLAEHVPAVARLLAAVAHISLSPLRMACDASQVLKYAKHFTFPMRYRKMPENADSSPIAVSSGTHRTLFIRFGSPAVQCTVPVTRRCASPLIHSGGGNSRDAASFAIDFLFRYWIYDKMQLIKPNELQWHVLRVPSRCKYRSVRISFRSMPAS